MWAAQTGVSALANHSQPIYWPNITRSIRVPIVHIISEWHARSMRSDFLTSSYLETLLAFATRTEIISSLGLLFGVLITRFQTNRLKWENPLFYWFVIHWKICSQYQKRDIKVSQVFLARWISGKITIGLYDAHSSSKSTTSRLSCEGQWREVSAIFLMAPKEAKAPKRKRFRWQAQEVIKCTNDEDYANEIRWEANVFCAVLQYSTVCTYLTSVTLIW